MVQHSDEFQAPSQFHVSQSLHTTQTTSKIHNVCKRNAGHLWHTRMSSGLTPTACVRTNTSEAPKSGSTASSRTSSTWSHTQKHAQKIQNVRWSSYNRSKMHLCRNRIFPTTISLTKKVLIHRINTRKNSRKTPSPLIPETSGSCKTKRAPIQYAQMGSLLYDFVSSQFSWVPLN